MGKVCKTEWSGRSLFVTFPAVVGYALIENEADESRLKKFMGKIEKKDESRLWKILLENLCSPLLAG